MIFEMRARSLLIVTRRQMNRWQEFSIFLYAYVFFYKEADELHVLIAFIHLFNWRKASPLDSWIERTARIKKIYTI